MSKDISLNNKDDILKGNVKDLLFSIILEEEFEDTKGEIRILISKNRQHNGQKKKY